MQLAARAAPGTAAAARPASRLLHATCTTRFTRFTQSCCALSESNRSTTEPAAACLHRKSPIALIDHSPKSMNCFMESGEGENLEKCSMCLGTLASAAFFMIKRTNFMVASVPGGPVWLWTSLRPCSEWKQGRHQLQSPAPTASCSQPERRDSVIYLLDWPIEIIGGGGTSEVQVSPTLRPESPSGRACPFWFGLVV